MLKIGEGIASNIQSGFRELVQGFRHCVFYNRKSSYYLLVAFVRILFEMVPIFVEYHGPFNLDHLQHPVSRHLLAHTFKFSLSCYCVFQS